jgi:hypothetical protein
MKRAIKRGVGVKVLVGVGLLAGAPAVMASTVNLKAQHRESRVKIVNLRLAELSNRSPHPETRLVEPVVKPRPLVSNPPPPPKGAPTPPVGAPPPPAPPPPSPPPPAKPAPPPPPTPPAPPPVMPPPPPYMQPPPPVTRAQSAPEINAASAASGLTLLLGGLLVLGARRRGA